LGIEAPRLDRFGGIAVDDTVLRKAIVRAEPDLGGDTAGLNLIAFDLDGLEQTVATFRRSAEAAGHDPSTLPVVVRVNGSVTEKPLDARGPLIGSAEQVAGDLQRLEEIDVDEVFWSMDTDPAEHVPAMERLLAAI